MSQRWSDCLHQRLLCHHLKDRWLLVQSSGGQVGSGLSHGCLTTHTTRRLFSVYSTRVKNSEISRRNVDHCNDILDNRIILPLQINIIFIIELAITFQSLKNDLNAFPWKCLRFMCSILTWIYCSIFNSLYIVRLSSYFNSKHDVFLNLTKQFKCPFNMAQK